MKRFFVIPMVLVLLSGLILGVSEAPAAKPIELKLTHQFPAGSDEDKFFHRWAKKVGEDSKGRLTFRIFPGAVLISAFETYDGVVKGVADLGGTYRFSRKGAELTGIISMFFAGVPDSATGTRILDDIRAKFPAYNKEWEGIKEVVVIADGPAMIVTKPRPVRTLEDLKGLELRVPVREAADMLKVMGGTPVGIPLADFVVGMEKGTVHGGTNQLSAIESFKLAPTAKFCTLFSLYNPANLFLVMNWDSFKKLPQDLQKVIDDSREWAKKEWVVDRDASDKDSMEWAKKLGMEFITLTPEERKRWLSILGPVQDRMAAELDAKGYPATEVLKFVRERKGVYVK